MPDCTPQIDALAESAREIFAPTDDSALVRAALETIARRSGIDLDDPKWAEKRRASHTAPDPRLAQALAILDALDQLVTPTRALHIAKDSRGVFVARLDDAGSGIAPEQHRGVTTRDALAQCVQANVDKVSP